jgi:hypothetical protein
VATPREVAAFWAAISLAQATAWCRAAEKEGRLVSVMLGSADESGRRASYALADWQTRLRRAPDPFTGLRLLSPFDPVIRDRARVARLFGFDYRFEAFVPAKKRLHGYYVLPILEGARFVGRLDPRHDRDRRILEVRRVWWEPGVRPTRARWRLLEESLAGLARRIGAEDVQLLFDRA